MSSILHIKGGRIIDPANNVDAVGDVYVVDGKIVSKLSADQLNHAHAIDAEGLVVCPGLVDVHVHLREPGGTQKENIHTGSCAAAAGGFTSVVCMPNTSPAADTVGTIQLIKDAAARHSLVNVFPTGTITVERKGEKLAPIGSLKQAGVVAITDDGDCVQNNDIMRHALEYAKMFDLPIMDHCQDMSLTRDAVMHEGEISLKLGLRGWPSAAEDIIISRNVILSEHTGAHIHMQHVSSGTAVDILRRAKQRGVRVTAELSPHHMSLTDEALQAYNTNFKMNPPLRSEDHRKALIEGLKDGTIDIIATDHAPHTDYEKDVEFDYAPFGVIGLETCLSVCIKTLHQEEGLDLPFIIARLTHKPAELLGLKKGTLSPGADADIMLFDPEASWTVDRKSLKSRSYNSPWLGQELPAVVKTTIVSGHVVYNEGEVVK